MLDVSSDYRELQTPTLPLRSGNILQDIAFINLEGLPGASSIYAGASLNAVVGNQQPRRSRSSRGSPRASSESRTQPTRTSEQESDTAGLDAGSNKQLIWQNIVQHISLSYFAENYFGPFLQHMTTKVNREKFREFSLVHCLFFISLNKCLI